LGIPSTYFVKNNEHLPYVLREAGQSNRNVKIFTCKDSCDLIRYIDKYKKRVFK